MESRYPPRPNLAGYRRINQIARENDKARKRLLILFVVLVLSILAGAFLFGTLAG